MDGVGDGRPIVRREWNRQNFQRREWLLADTGQELVFSDSANLRVREDLGPPDRVVHVLGQGEALSTYMKSLKVQSGSGRPQRR